MVNRPNGAQIAAVGIEIAVFAVLSYFGIKWLAKVLDPTSKQKEAAKKQVHRMFLLDELNLINKILNKTINFCRQALFRLSGKLVLDKSIVIKKCTIYEVYYLILFLIND